MFYYFRQYLNEYCCFRYFEKLSVFYESHIDAMKQVFEYRTFICLEKIAFIIYPDILTVISNYVTFAVS